MSEMSGKGEAQARVHRIGIFLKELAAFETEGGLALSAEQKEQLSRHVDGVVRSLAERFDIDTTESQAQISWGMRLATALGAVAFSIAVFLFFYRFWGLLYTPAQIAVLAVIPAVLLAGTEIAARRERTLYFAQLLAVLVIASFVLNLVVLGKIFNLTPSPNALLAWGALSVALGYSYGLRFPLAIGVVLILGRAAALLTPWDGSYLELIWHRPENLLFAGAALFAVGQAIPHRRRKEFPVVYRMVGLVAVFVSMLFLGASGQMSYLPLSEKAVRSIYLTAGLATAGLAMWRGVRTGSRGTIYLGMVFFNIYLLVRLADWWWEVLPRYLFFLIVGAIFVGFLFLFKRLRKRTEAL